ncbi:MAG: hypothetical protein ACK5WZ_05930 [Pseudobdellovibrionaceae bacterium]
MQNQMQNHMKLTIPIKKMIQTQCHFFETESQLLQHLENKFLNSVLIFDERFQKNKFVKKFPNRFAVQSGEATKSLESLSHFLMELSLKKIDAISKNDLSFVAMGGGSIGDFAGFVASIYKRGCPLIQIPTTWLAAIDSSHGGKNALNL